MKKLLLTVALLSFSGMVNAFGDVESNSAAGAIAGAKAQAGAIAGSRSSVHNRNSNRQNQRQGQHQGQLQGQLQGNVGLGSGNTTNTSLNQSYVEDYSEMYDDYTPPAYAPSMGVSAPCKVGISAGGGIPGISITGGGYITDEDCVEAETIRMGLQSGDTKNAGAANVLLKMRLDAALAERTLQNEEDEVAQILSPKPELVRVSKVRQVEINNGVWQH